MRLNNPVPSVDDIKNPITDFVVKDTGPEHCLVIRKTPFTDEPILRELHIDATELVKKLQSPELIQNALSDLSVDDREFLITGMVDDSFWNGN